MPPSDVQAAFVAALRDPVASMPGNLAGPDRTPVARRFAVYRNNVVAGLIGVVAGAFPAVQRIVGEDFFKAMARAYVLARPPQSPMLMEYGADFADFIAGFAPAASVPYLADVARIERAWREAYHAAEAVPLAPADFAGVPETDLPAINLDLHPSLRVVCSGFPAFTIWRMNAGYEPVARVDLGRGGEDALIVRPHAEVEIRSLPPGGSAFIEALAHTHTLHEAADLAMTADARFDLSGNIAGLIDSGGVVGYSVKR